MKENAKIPKVIHYFWFGNNPKPKIVKKCIASWKKVCPDYEIKEWNESNFDVNICDYTREAYEAKMWGFVSDYARLWVIYRYGGFYLDTDVELIRSLDTLRQNKTFFASEDNEHISTGLGFGSIKETPVIKAMCEDYEKMHFKRPDGTLRSDIPCPQIQTKTIKRVLKGFVMSNKVLKIDDIVFYPKEYFSPFDNNSRTLKKTKNTYGIHWYTALWQSKQQRREYKKNVFKTRIVNAIQSLIGEEGYLKLRKKLFRR